MFVSSLSENQKQSSGFISLALKEIFNIAEWRSGNSLGSYPRGRWFESILRNHLTKYKVRFIFVKAGGLTSKKIVQCELYKGVTTLHRYESTLFKHNRKSARFHTRWVWNNFYKSGVTSLNVGDTGMTGF